MLRGFACNYKPESFPHVVTWLTMSIITVVLVVQEMLLGVLCPVVHDNRIDTKNAVSPKIGSSCPSRSLTYSPNRTGLYPHPKHVLAFSAHCVFRCKFTFTYGKGIQNFQLLSPCIVPRQPQAHNPRSSRSCASMAEACGKRGEISNSNGTGRLHKTPTLASK